MQLNSLAKFLFAKVIRFGKNQNLASLKTFDLPHGYDVEAIFPVLRCKPQISAIDQLVLANLNFLFILHERSRSEHFSVITSRNNFC